MNAKRIGFLLTVLLAILLPAGADPHARTLVNGEQAPFLYTVVPPDHPVVPQSAQSIADAFRLDDGGHLALAASGGMVPFPYRTGTLVGYFGGPPSALQHRVVVLPLTESDAPVRIDRSVTVRIGGDPLRLSPGDLPSWQEPVMIDGVASDWDDADPVFEFGADDQPRRVESASIGAEISADEARFWRMGGTAVRELYTIDGTRRSFLALRAHGPILNNTGYHVRFVKEGSTRETIQEFSVLVDGNSGPVVYRHDNDGTVRWVGQYALRGNFLELEVDRPLVQEIIGDALGTGNHRVTFDFATSHRSSARSERFTLGIVALRESFFAP